MDWVDTFMRAGMLAPSGDNLQPWRFGVDRPERRLLLGCDPRRDPSPMNDGDTMARISLGALVANVFLTHLHNRRPLPAASVHDDGVVELRGVAFGAPPGEIPPLLRRRYTDRGRYGGSVLSSDLSQAASEAARAFAALARQLSVPAPEAALLRVHVVTQPALLAHVAAALTQADRWLFSHQAARSAFFEALRRGLQGEQQDAVEGLPIWTLKLGALERRMLRLTLRLPQRTVSWLGFARNVARRTRWLLRHTPALALITAPDWTKRTDVLLGLLTQLFWLELTKRHYVTQPMMALPVLRNMERGGLLPPQTCDPLEDAVREAVPEVDSDRLGFIMRIGRATDIGRGPCRLPWKALAYPLTAHQDLDSQAEAGLPCNEASSR